MDFIVSVGEREFERELHELFVQERSVWVIYFSLVARVLVLYGFSRLEPTDLVSLEGFLRKEARLHPLLKESVRLGEVADYDLDRSGEVDCIFHAEGKPLQITAAVGVRTDENVILIFLDSSDMIAIGTFEICIKFHITLMVAGVIEILTSLFHLPLS